MAGAARGHQHGRVPVEDREVAGREGRVPAGDPGRRDVAQRGLQPAV